MALVNFKPARQRSTIESVVDLDAILAEPKAFQWRGKTHVIRPIDTLTFLKVTNEMAKIQALIGQDGKPSHKEVIEAYAGVFSSVCDTISKKDVLEMTQAQVGALFQLVVDCVTGRAQKKTQATTPAT